MDNPSRALPRRFWPRLSIRGLMILVLVLGGGIGWVAQRTKIQRNAVRGISVAGGVRYNWQYVSEKYDPKASPPGPKWLRDIVGPDLLDTVVLANLLGPDVDDRVMSHVVRCLASNDSTCKDRPRRRSPRRAWHGSVNCHSCNE